MLSSCQETGAKSPWEPVLGLEAQLVPCPMASMFKVAGVKQLNSKMLKKQQFGG